MANNENLKKRVPFTKDDPRINRKGAPKGVQQSKTRFLKFLEVMVNMKNPITGEMEDISLIERMDLAQFHKALKGDTRAYQEIMDRLEGKSVQHNIIEEVEKPIFKQIDLDVTSDDSSD
jgi:septum formation inhibitor-activating ATPase MinD